MGRDRSRVRERWFAIEICNIEWAQKAVGKLSISRPVLESSNGACMGGQAGGSWSWLQHGVRDERRQPSSRGIYLVGQETPSLYRRERERAREEGERWISRITARATRVKRSVAWGEGRMGQGPRVCGTRQELKDEDMHINRETSTEMSDHR